MLMMVCPEKEILQQKCAASWDAYINAANQAGLSVDPQGHIRSPSISELVAAHSAADPTSITRSVYAAAVRLRGEHLKTSRELSRHFRNIDAKNTEQHLGPHDRRAVPPQHSGPFARRGGDHGV